MRSLAASEQGSDSSSDEEAQRSSGACARGARRSAWVGAAVGLVLVATALLLATTGNSSSGAATASARAAKGPAEVERLGGKTNFNSNSDPFSEEDQPSEGTNSDITAGAGDPRALQLPAGKGAHAHRHEHRHAAVHDEVGHADHDERQGAAGAAGAGALLAGVPLNDALTQALAQGEETTQPPSPASMPAHIQPGHRCAEYEENHAGLCYTKCLILAGPEYPHRGSPWTCCKDNPCKFNAFKHGFGMIACSGYAVAGTAGKSCPHQHGACNANEEMFMNECYKTCKELTNNEYPHRTAAATCCKEQSTLSCMNPMKLKTSASFDVGGGAGDGDPSTPHAPHKPHTIG